MTAGHVGGYDRGFITKGPAVNGRCRHQCVTTSKSRGCHSGLMMVRNNLVAYLARGSWALPPVIRQPHSCRNCPVADVCTVTHAALEGGTVESFGADNFSTYALGACVHVSLPLLLGVYERSSIYSSQYISYPTSKNTDSCLTKNMLSGSKYPTNVLCSFDFFSTEVSACEATPTLIFKRCSEPTFTCCLAKLRARLPQDWQILNFANVESPHFEFISHNR